MKSSPTCTENWVRAAEFHVPVIRLLAKGHDFGAGFEPQALKARWMDVPYGGRKTGEARPYFAANRRRCKILSSEQPARVLPANLSSTDITVNPHAFGFQTQGFAPPDDPAFSRDPRPSSCDTQILTSRVLTSNGDTLSHPLYAPNNLAAVTPEKNKKQSH